MPHQPVMHKMFRIPAMPLTQFHQPPYSHTFSLDSHHRSPVAARAMAPRIPDSKSLHTAIRMLMATMAKGNTLNQGCLPMPHLYLIIMKPMQPATAAYSLA